MDTHSMVLDILQRASSQNAEILKPAEAKLREWETQPGFYTILYNILSNHSLELNVRWIAVLYMKNGVDKYWRKNAPNAISEEEKQHIKQGLVCNFHEPVNQIALQLAVLISKIARMDCPKEWPELLPTLLHSIEHTGALVQHRSLLTLHHVVKAISSKRLPGDRKQFQDFTSQIYTFILNLWNTFTECFVRDIMQNAAEDLITTNLEKALLTLRILMKLTIHGFYKPHLNQDCMLFLNAVFDRAHTALECRKRLKNNYLVEQCEKFIIYLTKILRSVLDIHPFSFIELIKPSLEFTVFYVFTPGGDGLLFERFIIQCFNLIKEILLCAEYRHSKEPETERAHYLKTEFFRPETLSEMCKKLVSHYFILTQDDLELWDSDPETFASDEGGESWKYSLRPSMESMFVTLFRQFRDVLAQNLLEMVRETNVIVPPEDMAGILRKDAVYNAVGLAAFDMYEEIDFDQWFTNTLTEELKIKHNNYRIIRRRVSWLIGNWTGIKLSFELRPAMYNCVANLLSADEDMAVRLTACTALRDAIDDFEFNSEQFRPYLDQLFNLLFVLLKEAKECETKMQVLNVMSLMVERVGQTITPHTDALIYYLPLLWRESDDHNMLRCAIVSTLVQLVKALGTVSAELNPFLLPVIQLGTDTNQSSIVYLLEDCLQLWLTVLENSKSMTPEMMQLFNNMPALLESSSENLRCCLIITRVHVLLAPELAMRTHGAQIVAVCDSIISDMRSEGVLMLTRLLEMFVKASPTLGSETIKPILPKIFEFILRNDESSIIMAMYLTIMARVLLASHNVFTEAIHEVALKNNDNDMNLLCSLLDIWLAKMPNVSQSGQRKLLALGLANLLTTQSQPVLQRISAVLTRIMESLHDITKTDDNGVNSDALVMTEGQSPSYFDDKSENCYETEHDRRKKHLVQLNPVHTVVLKDYLQSQLYALRNQIGQLNYEQLLSTVCADTLSQLKEYVTF